MATLDFIRERDGGFVRVSTVSNYGSSLTLLLKSFGLEPQPEALSEVTREIAAACIATILWRDMAYGSSEFMPKQRADGYADEFLEHDRGGALFCEGEVGSVERTVGLRILATHFSEVVLVVCPEVATCLLIEDED